MSDEDQRWSYSTGERGRNRVRAYTERKSGHLYLEWRETTATGSRKRRRTSLGPDCDQETAKTVADQAAAAFARDETPAVLRDSLTLKELFDAYLLEETPHKGESKRGHDWRCAHMFIELLGESRDVTTLDRQDWNDFIRARRTGEVLPPSRVQLSEREKGLLEEGKPIVGNRTIEYDLKFLWSALNWATSARGEDGDRLLAEHPLHGTIRSRDWPDTVNPRRPLLTDEQYAAMLVEAADMDWRFRLALILAHETGHRIASIRNLMWSDIDLESRTVHWRGEVDKQSYRHDTPLTTAAVSALQEVRQATGRIGDTYVLPSPEDPNVPCSKQAMDDWWDEAQAALEEAGVIEEGVEQLGWHSLRRKFARDYRHLPIRELMDLGGWQDPQTLIRCYLRPTEEDLRNALAERDCSRPAIEEVA